MNPAGWKTALSLLTLCASFTAAGEESGVSFSHEDWELVCDNTRTCRMAGYSSEDDTYKGHGGSVLITRAAGPDTPLQGEVTRADIDDGGDALDDSPHVLTLWIDGKSKGKLTLREKELVYPLTQAQIRALLAAARSDGKIGFEGDAKRGPKSFTLSGKGVSAVMLKMDEFQGRIGTPGALIRKGKKPEENVLPPLPMPVIRAAKVSGAPSRALTAPEVASLKPLAQSLVKDSECDFNRREFPGDGEFTLTPLDERHVLISTLCWRAAYNEGYGYWVMDSALKGKPERVTLAGSNYEEGVIHSAQRGRGPADCYYGAIWVWDGQGFRQSAEWRTGMCRGIHLGGTWRLPTRVTKVIHEDGLPRDPK
jgi:hypothetical protein